MIDSALSQSFFLWVTGAVQDDAKGAAGIIEFFMEYGQYLLMGRFVLMVLSFLGNLF